MGPLRNPLPIHVEFGRRVRARRKELGWTLERLSHESGLDLSYVSQTELGKRNIAITNICKLARALGVDAGVLLSGLADWLPEDRRRR